MLLFEAINGFQCENCKMFLISLSFVVPKQNLPSSRNNGAKDN